MNIAKLLPWIRHRKWWLLGIATGLALLIAIVPIYAFMTTRHKIYSVQQAPHADVAIIFGAGLESPHKPSNFLESRLLAGIKLYNAGQVKVLLVSGDNRRVGYDEPTAMHDYLVERGIPDKAIVIDYAGFNTYDTCYRAHAIFGISKAILVTHGYHLPRAVMTCGALGVASTGVRADRSQASFPKNYLAREVLSVNKAALQIVLHAKPDVLGKPEAGVTKALHN